MNDERWITNRVYDSYGEIDIKSLEAHFKESFDKGHLSVQRTDALDDGTVGRAAQLQEKLKQWVT